MSQVSQAGKSAVLQQVRRRIMEESTLATGHANPFQVLYLNLAVRINANLLFSSLLEKLGDPAPYEGNGEERQRRTRILMRERKVELLLVDEVQHLVRQSHDKVDVTDELKRFLDQGLCPVVFAGNEDSKPFFERNQQLASRLGAPLELSPVSSKDRNQIANFKQFCGDLDAELVKVGATREPSNLIDKDVLNALLFASGGHIGRVFRIVEVAVEHAALRDASHIETADLVYAIDSFAISQTYINRNPLRND